MDLAEKLRSDGFDVTLITPADRVSAWTVNTLEQHSIQKRILEMGVEVRHSGADCPIYQPGEQLTEDPV
jgi:dimethylamine/trimethylamine dehydrogenase